MPQTNQRGANIRQRIETLTEEIKKLDTDLTKASDDDDALKIKYQIFKKQAEFVKAWRSSFGVRGAKPKQRFYHPFTKNPVNGISRARELDNLLKTSFEQLGFDSHRTQDVRQLLAKDLAAQSAAIDPEKGMSSKQMIDALPGSLEGLRDQIIQIGTQADTVDAIQASASGIQGVMTSALREGAENLLGYDRNAVIDTSAKGRAYQTVKRIAAKALANEVVKAGGVIVAVAGALYTGVGNIVSSWIWYTVKNTIAEQAEAVGLDPSEDIIEAVMDEAGVARPTYSQAQVDKNQTLIDNVLDDETTRDNYEELEDVIKKDTSTPQNPDDEITVTFGGDRTTGTPGMEQEDQAQAAKTRREQERRFKKARRESQSEEPEPEPPQPAGAKGKNSQHSKTRQREQELLTQRDMIEQQDIERQTYIDDSNPDDYFGPPTSNGYLRPSFQTQWLDLKKLQTFQSQAHKEQEYNTWRENWCTPHQFGAGHINNQVVIDSLTEKIARLEHEIRFRDTRQGLPRDERRPGFNFGQPMDRDGVMNRTPFPRTEAYNQLPSGIMKNYQHRQNDYPPHSSLIPREVQQFPLTREKHGQQRIYDEKMNDRTPAIDISNEMDLEYFYRRIRGY